MDDTFEDVTIENMDPIVEQFVEKPKPKNKGPLAPQWPFRMMIVGSSSLGKTNTLLNIIMKQVIFDKIYIYLKDPTEDKYEFLFSLLQSLQKNFEEPIYEIGTKPEDVVNTDDLDATKQNLIIIDDFVVEKNQKTIEDLYIRCRKRNASVIYQTQNLFEVPQNVRKNCNYVLLFKTNKRERKEIAKTYATDIESKEFENLYMDATAEPFSFLMIDMKTSKECMKYRQNFDGLRCTT